MTPFETVFRPPRGAGPWFGAGAAALSLVLALALLLEALDMDASLGQLARLAVAALFLGLAALFAYWTWGCLSLRYTIDRNALTIRWGFLRQLVPLDSVERLIPAGEAEMAQVEGVSWPGYQVGRAQVEPLGDVLFYSTHRTMSDVLYVRTPAEVYAISVDDQVGFAQAVQQHQATGPDAAVGQEVRREGIAAQTFWLDPLARTLTLVLAGAFAVVVAYVLQAYPDLDESVRLRFPALGGVARMSAKSALLDIPLSAFGLVVLNLTLAAVFHSRERMVSYVLLIAAAAIQVVLLVAAAVAVA